MTLLMDEDKTLRITSYSTNYQGENLAESIIVLMPQWYNGFDIRECTVNLIMSITNADDLSDPAGEIFSLKLEDELYLERLQSRPIPLEHRHTTNYTDIDIWIELHNASGLVAKTNIVPLKIFNHRTVSESLSETTIDLFDEFILKMETLKQQCEETLSKVEVCSSQCQETARMIIDIYEEINKKREGE